MKAYWPPKQKPTKEFLAIDNLHLLFYDPILFMPLDAATSQVISNFNAMIANPQDVKDATCMVIVGDAQKTTSQVRWMRDVRERLANREGYYERKRQRDGRHKANRNRKLIAINNGQDQIA